MNCPKCGLPFPMWEKNCLQCGINILEFLERRANAPKPAPAARGTSPAGAAGSRRRRGGPSARLAAGVLAALGLAGGAAWCVREPLPANAFHDGEAAVAFVPPPGWRVAPGAGEGWRFRNVARLSGPSGRIEVEVAPAALPVEEHLDSLIEEEFNGRRVEWTARGGARVAGVEGRRLAFRAVGGAKAETVLGEFLFLPGKGRNYLFRFYTSPSLLSRGNGDWTAFLASIRLTRSPFSFLSRRRPS